MSHVVSHVAPRAARRGGFTLVEAAVVVAIMGILLAMGMPAMSKWLLARRAASAAVFYQDGMVMARNQAIAHNSASRLALTENANGQMDWRVDICLPNLATPCDDDHGTWSTVDSAVAGFKSVGRSAQAMPGEADMAQSLAPSGATDVYFTPLGWVDARVAPRLASITIAPAARRQGAFPRTAVVLTLGGIAAVCNPDAADHTARKCPPSA